MCENDANDLYVRHEAFESGRDQVIAEIVELFENCSGDLQLDLEHWLTDNGAL